MARYMLIDQPAIRGGPRWRPTAGKHANYETLSHAHRTFMVL